MERQMHQMPPGGLADHVLRTLRLAWPLILSRIGITLMAMVDVLVLGRAGTDQLAEYVLGLTLYEGLSAVLAGLVIGVGVLTARETGAGRVAHAGPIWRRGLGYGVAAGIFFALVLQAAPGIYLATGQEADLAARAGAVARIVGLTLPFVALFLVTTTFLEALHRPEIGMIAVAIANLGNLGLNIILVFGAGPVPAFGAQGAAIATVINIGCVSVGLWAWTRFFMRGRADLGMIGGAAPGTSLAEQIRLGLGAALSFAFEAGAFMMMTIFAGWLGAVALAVQGIAFSLLATVFMVAFGIANATQVRVGNAWGRRDPGGIAAAGWTGCAMAVLFTGLLTLASLTWPDAILRLFTDEPGLVAIAATVLPWVSLALVFDGAQTVMSHACRGRGDAWIPTLLHFGSYWIVMVPAAYLLTFTAGQGLPGIYQGIVLASIVSLVLLGLRFRALCRGSLMDIR